ncbi:MAG: hypothetical protein CME62_16665 [Halobacteriovoraceae bacterium]|nr:hypothetical protein [Halobacteriovoraceae bacterium]|tara:strand:- start:18044 stop:18667 length:624 start_codon:yes stop_codon:yes gene_type:complete
MQELKNLIENENYSAALDFLNQSDSMALPIKYYNLGFIHFKQNDLPSALYYLEKAKFSGLFSEEVDSALYQVKTELGLRVLENDYSWIDQLYLSSNTLNLDIFIVLMGFLLFGILLGAYKKLFKTAALCLTMFTALGIFTYQLSEMKTYIAFEDTIIHQGPSQIFEANQVIPKGLKFVIGKSFKDWSYIKYPSVLSGWVKDIKAKKL